MDICLSSFSPFFSVKRGFHFLEVEWPLLLSLVETITTRPSLVGGFLGKLVMDEYYLFMAST